MFFRRKIQADKQPVQHTENDKKSLVPLTLELADISKGIYGASRDLNQCTGILNQTSSEVASNIHINKAMVEQVKNEVNLISTAAEKIYQNAKNNEVLSKENLKHMTFSVKDLHSSIDKVEELFAYFDEVASSLEKLQSYSERIGNITTYIDQIASKTSLVSINASIEAARAGEVGRGFMVITDEIKNLANQSKEFSSNISGMISDMTDCIGQLNQSSRDNYKKITETKERIAMLENNLGNMAKSTEELDKNIKATLMSSDEIKASTQAGNETVGELMNSFEETITCSRAVSEAVQTQNTIIEHLVTINESAKTISEEQLNLVLDEKMADKLRQIGEKIMVYEGARDSKSLKKVAAKYQLHSLNYVNEAGCFETAANEKAIGFNIFKVEPHYIEFKKSSKQIKVYPLSRNLFTGDIIRYVLAKEVHTKQLISMGFNLDALKKISEMTMEDIASL